MVIYSQPTASQLEFIYVLREPLAQNKTYDGYFFADNVLGQSFAASGALQDILADPRYSWAASWACAYAHIPYRMHA